MRKLRSRTSASASRSAICVEALGEVADLAGAAARGSRPRSCRPRPRRRRARARARAARCAARGTRRAAPATSRPSAPAIASRRTSSPHAVGDVRLLLRDDDRADRRLVDATRARRPRGRCGSSRGGVNSNVSVVAGRPSRARSCRLGRSCQLRRPDFSPGNGGTAGVVDAVAGRALEVRGRERRRPARRCCRERRLDRVRVELRDARSPRAGAR